MAASGVKTQLPFDFIVGGGNTVNTQNVNSQLLTAEKRGFSETFLFSKITFWKKKTLTSLDNYSIHLPFTGITFQNKGNVLNTVQLLNFITRVLLSNQLYVKSQVFKILNIDQPHGIMHKRSRKISTKAPHFIIARICMCVYAYASINPYNFQTKSNLYMKLYMHVQHEKTNKCLIGHQG